MVHGFQDDRASFARFHYDHVSVMSTYVNTAHVDAEYRSVLSDVIVIVLVLIIACSCTFIGGRGKKGGGFATVSSAYKVFNCFKLFSCIFCIITTEAEATTWVDMLRILSLL